MPASHKIITKLRERRQIEAEFRQMIAASSDLDYRRLAVEIASLGSQVIPVLVDNLANADVRMLSALGTVAAHLNHEQVSQALHRTILQPRRSDSERMAAMTILERFLGEPLDEGLMTALADPERMAVLSLEEVLTVAARDSAVLIDYIQGLDQQEPDVVLAVIRTLRELGDATASTGLARRVVEPLRMMAQDVRTEISSEALQALGAIRLPEAARALQTLAPIVEPTLRPLAERSLRKLRFVGVDLDDLSLPDPSWRALISPVDGLGHQSLWFIQENKRTSQARFLNVLLNDRFGLVEAVGHHQVPVQMLPLHRPFGYLHDISMPNGSGTMLMLEASFDLGRRMVRDLLPNNWKTQIPVAGAMRLLSPWLWEVGGTDSLPDRVLPEVSSERELARAESGHLLSHPAFSTWTAQSTATLIAAEEMQGQHDWSREIWIRRLASELFSDAMVAQIFSRRLATMSEWLLLSGDEPRAQQARIVSEEILGKNPQNLPFVRALVHRDLERTLHSLES